MIIGNNNFNPNANNFKRNVNSIKANTGMSNSITNNQYKDVSNSEEMIDKSLQILQDRLNRGLISYEDFQKQCEKIGKLRK